MGLAPCLRQLAPQASEDGVQVKGCMAASNNINQYISPKTMLNRSSMGSVSSRSGQVVEEDKGFPTSSPTGDFEKTHKFLL